MKNYKKVVYICLILSLTLMMLFTGCSSNQSGSTMDEPDITVGYLEGDYAQQLLRDGAEHYFGNINIIDMEDGSIVLDIKTMTFVEDTSHPDGYYCEDRNFSLGCQLAEEARCTFIQGNMSIPQIVTAAEFVEAYRNDIAQNGGEENAEYVESRLFDIYIMNGQIELVLAKVLP